MTVLPKISIITPSFNQGQYLEQTILSVLAQDYSNLEYIVIDGGSADESVEIIKKYSDRLAYWVSEPDRGQSHAINKGFARATGEIVAWINSDDYYEPLVFKEVAAIFLSSPGIKILMGDCNLVNEDGVLFGSVVNHERGARELKRYWVENSIPTQPAIFFRRELLDECGLLDESLHYSMDYDLWMRFAQKYTFFHSDLTLANYRFHPEAKGGDQDWSKFLPECKIVSNRHLNNEITAEILQSEKNLFERNQLLEKRILNLDSTLQLLLDKADRQLAERDQQLSEHKYQVDILRQQNTEMQQYIAALLNSFSWRLTAPLRRLLTAGRSLLSSNSTNDSAER